MSPIQQLDLAEELLENVYDPEIPVLSIRDLGILRKIQWHESGMPEIIITPTYSGCPATVAIEVNIRAALQEGGIDPVKITTQLSPAWTTDLMSENAREKLRAYGIAPPVEQSADKNALFGQKRVVPCPLCGSTNTQMVSQFGSTACKALFKCIDCLEPFDYFKCH